MAFSWSPKISLICTHVRRLCYSLPHTPDPRHTHPAPSPLDAATSPRAPASSPPLAPPLATHPRLEPATADDALALSRCYRLHRPPHITHPQSDQCHCTLRPPPHLYPGPRRLTSVRSGSCTSRLRPSAWHPLPPLRPHHPGTRWHISSRPCPHPATPTLATSVRACSVLLQSIWIEGD